MSSLFASCLSPLSAARRTRSPIRLTCPPLERRLDPRATNCACIVAFVFCPSPPLTKFLKLRQLEFVNASQQFFLHLRPVHLGMPRLQRQPGNVYLKFNAGIFFRPIFRELENHCAIP